MTGSISLNVLPSVIQNDRREEKAVSTAAKSTNDSVEAAIIRRVQSGDIEAFYELVRPYERAVFLAAVSLLKNDADAEEVAQEAILKAFKNIGRFRQEAKFSTWLIQISINEAKMKVRKDRRHLYESIEEGQINDDGELYTQGLRRLARNPLRGVGAKGTRRSPLECPQFTSREVPNGTCPPGC